MMKRWMAMGMALCLTAASLAGCSGTKDAAESTQAEAETSAEEAAAEEETAKESDLDLYVCNFSAQCADDHRKKSGYF